jgi:hypothetical protein
MPEPVSTISGGLGIAEKLFKAGRWLIDRFKHRPRGSLHIVPLRQWWSVGAAGKTRVMVTEAELLVTNDSDKISVFFPRAELRSKDGRLRSNEVQIGRDNEVPAHHSGELRVTFFRVLPFRKSGESFDGRVILIDQFNRRHRSQLLTFCFMGSNDWRPEWDGTELPPV